MELSQGNSLISSDLDTKGFDLSAGTNWIYPLNYPLRGYQYDIAKNSLFSNTLVCLPTGLGKTLIAAVVMYNFWRWYPRGKIVFLAPTKPLVNQQISACHDIMGIPSTDTIELTGSMNPKNREIAWFTKRVIFATPQVFQNDLEKNIAPGELVRCVVIDEAHKALGKHAYCESLRLLRTKNSCYRVLALSATPGSRIEDVCQVITNLSISNLELRDETSPDIMPHLNKKQMDIILVALDDDLARFKEKYVSIMDRYVRLLVQYKVLKNNTATMNKGRMFYLYKEFQSKTNRPGNYGQIMKTLGRCMSLSHAYELMIRHGLRTFATFCQSHAADTWMTDEPELQKLIDDILEFLGPFPDVCPLPDGSIADIPQDLVFGHTKFYKLKNLLLEHFNKFAARNEETRAIVFVEYRDSVNEVYVSLLQLRPTLRPKMFVGQAGQKRKHQMQAMKAFRNNEANVLISTSVGEEGLDVGEVDLIVCFDISQSSPIRLVQRMGRTGRRRDGRIVMLVTDGREHLALKSTIAKKDTLNAKVLNSSNVVSSLFKKSPRMVPPDLDPVCSKMHMVLQPKTLAAQGKRKRKEIESDLLKQSKKKVKVAKNDAALPIEVEKTTSMQSSMLKFLKKSIANENCGKVSNSFSEISQPNEPAVQVSQSQPIKLFTSDAVALEFLTLCAIKASKSEGMYNELNRMDETYLTASIRDDVKNFLDYPVPDLSILDCIASMEERPESATARVSEYFGSGHIENDDIQMLEHNQCDNLEYHDDNNSLADGKFNYEDLLEDSFESDKSIFSDPENLAMCDDNTDKLSKNEENDKCQSNDRTNDENKELSGVENDGWFADLWTDDSFEEAISPQRSPEGVSDNKQRCEEENIPVNRGNFEIILDISSDSEIPPSQEEPRTKKIVKKSLINFANNVAIENQKQLDVRISLEKPSTSFASNSISGNSNNTYIFTGKPTGFLGNLLNGSDPDRIQTTRSNVNTCSVNKSIDTGKRSYFNDKESLGVSEITSAGSQRSTSRNKEPLASKPGVASRTALPVSIIKSSSAENNLTNENCNKTETYPADPSEDDDDVIFIAEVTATPKPTHSREKSMHKSIHKIEKVSDDEILIEKEIRTAECQNASDSNADTSSACTLTQILKLIENSSPRGVSSHIIPQDTQKPSDINEDKRSHGTMEVERERNTSIEKEKIPKGKLNSADDSVSPYFTHINSASKNSKAVLQSEELLEVDLDLSDIKWEDDFENLEQCANSSKAETLLDKQLEEQSVDTSCRGSATDRRVPSLSLNKKEESFKTDSDNSVSVFFRNNIEAKNPQPQTAVDFNIGDYEWESDFESPSNPVESFRQLSRSNNASQLNDFKQKIGSELTSKKLSLNSGKSTTKKLLSLERSKTSKPSTSKEVSESDSDVEVDLFRKFNGKYDGSNNDNSRTNFVLTTNQKYNLSNGSRFLTDQKENVQPNSGLAGLTAISANSKNINLRKEPFSIRVAAASREKIGSSERRPFKKKKCQHRDRVKSEFLADEAEVSSGTSSGSSGEDCDLDGFISHTQQQPDTVDMHVHYLQSVKDIHRTDAFHFKKPRAFVPDDEIFSQPMSQEENSAYLNDSFCVNGSDEDAFAETNEISLLELAEKALKKKRRKHSKNSRGNPPKKRRVESLSDNTSSSEDEIEKLKKEIFEESMLLKEKKN